MEPSEHEHEQKLCLNASSSLPDNEEDTRIVLTRQPLDVSQACAFVKTPKAGALSSFLGVTRDNFAGKPVLKLEYESYVPMAVEEIKKLCKEAFEQWDLLKISLSHRLGDVPIGEESVLIWVSSAHRQHGLEAVSCLIDKLKERVPIWKKEWYDEKSDSPTSAWKTNCECLKGTKTD